MARTTILVIEDDAPIRRGLVDALRFGDRPAFHLLNVGETHYPYALPDEDPSEWPRISGVHASLKVEGGHLYVRDENSNNGTLVNGNRLSPGVWSPVPPGSILRFGPLEFSAAVQ